MLCRRKATTPNPPETEVTRLAIRGLECAACVRRVEKALAKLPGVQEASVNFALHEARISHESSLDVAALIGSIERAGYGAMPVEQAPAPSKDPVGRLVVCGFLTAIIVALSMAWHPRPEWANIALLLLTTPVVFYFGSGFFKGAWAALRNRTATMDTLVAVGAGAAWVGSVFALFTQAGHHESNHIYFETAAVIVAAILLGRHLEHGAKRRMSSAMQMLLKLAPDKVVRLGPQGDSEVPAASIVLGDLLRVRPGDRVAVDGTVREGTSSVDESSITGEAIPIAKQAGDRLISGTVNLNGSLVMEAERVGSETTLARITNFVARAQGSKAPLQSLADRVAAIFVPIVLVIAVITFAVHAASGQSLLGALNPAIAVLIIACPCALGLATPTALVTGMGRGSQLGVLIRDGEVLERAAAVTTVVFDKTGTLTEGRATLDRAQVFGPWSETQALQIAASIEAHGTHPLGVVIGEAAQAAQLELLPTTGVHATHGIGIEATIEGNTWRMGRQTYAAPEQSGSPTGTQVWLSDGIRTAVFEFTDAVKPTSAEAIQQLKQMGIRTAMLTGDRRAVAERLSVDLGIDEFEAEVLPTDKGDAIERFKQHGPTIMVGDGINDAPALAMADVGIAMDSGADIAIESASMTVLGSDPRRVVVAIRLARATVATIKMNLFWAFAYNVVMIPLAAWGVLNPMLAAAAMAMSSVSVVANCLRLRGFMRSGNF